MPGDEAVPDGRIGWCMEATPVRGCRRECQSGISDGQRDGRVTGAPYREVNSKVATAPILKVEDKDRVK